MEPSFIHYIKQIIKTISIVLVWMIINIKYGIMDNHAFFDESIKTNNYIFYGWLIVSFTVVIILLIRIWNEPFEPEG